MALASRLVKSFRQNLRRALHCGDLEEADQILSRLKTEDPLSVETRGFELEFLLNAGRIPQADMLASQLCLLFPQSSRIFFLAGKVAYRAKQYAKAESRLRESARLHPHPLSRWWLGKTLTQKGGLEEAEALLESVRSEYPGVLKDLAWLCERRQEYDRAISFYEDYLKKEPEDEFSQRQLARIKAHTADSDLLIEEMEQLEEFGEAVPEELFPDYIQKLFETGQNPRARAELRKRLDSLAPRDQVKLAWVCYRVQAFDLALELFLENLPANSGNFKYLNALESAAAKCCRTAQLFPPYRELANRDPHFWGRIKALGKKTTPRSK
jgi:tetratricopeptide (TPR) repeat protein